MRAVFRNVPALCCAAACLLAMGCVRSRALDYYGKVPDFELTSQEGRKITLSDLTGKVWIADTMYTTCTGPCPMMSARMRTVARETASISNVRIVSFTVDPEHDTPEALLAYSKHFRAIPDRWFFLTGQASILDRVSKDGLRLSQVDGSLDHSTEFVLVDRNALVRGFYFPFDAGQLKRLIADARYLAGT